jgi:hypothetical protein
MAGIQILEIDLKESNTLIYFGDIMKMIVTIGFTEKDTHLK